MNSIRFIFLSLISFIFFSGFLFEERGMSLPAPTIKVSSQDNAFPVIKIIAHPKKEQDTNISSTPKVSHKKENKTKQVQSPKQEERITRIKRNTEEKIKPRRRKSGHANKLIFNKHTSYKDIPLPLPKLSSLKLQSLAKSIPSVPVSKIPILNALLPEGSTVAHRRIKQKYLFQSNKNKHNNSAHVNLDIANIRIGKSNDYTTLIFDSYKWAGYNQESIETSNVSGKYKFNYEPENNRIVALIQGYNAFSALLGDQRELFNENDIVKDIYIDRYINEDSIQFIIKLRKKVKMRVVDVQDPGRIILNLYPQ